MTFQHWQQRIGRQRDWVWRGWQTRYTYIRAQGGSIPSSSTPLILLHGFGASIGHWRHNLAALSQHHTVYALDLVGFGASEKKLTNYNVELWVAQVYDFWRVFIQQPVVLIGNSIGSLVCLAAAAAHPEMAQGVVMLSLPDPSVREESMPRLIRPIIAAVERSFTSPLFLGTLFYIVRRPKIVRPWAAIAYADPAAVTEELLEILLAPAQDRGSAQAFCAILKSMTGTQFGPSVKSLLPTLEIPLFLMWGKQDRMIPYSPARQFTGYNPNLQLLELDNAGHCLHDECPERVNQEILSWITTWSTRVSDKQTGSRTAVVVNDPH
ncbi:MAG TPA: alpha/beta fold hydrolase [Candidatus Caenarcaniphilales bacterium]